MATARVRAGEPEWRAGSRGRAWRWTAGTGVALLVLVTIHMIAHHFVVNEIGGLRTYHQVLAYIGNPVMFAIEGGFLVVVTIHAMLGLRGVLLDLDLSKVARRRIDRILVIAGSATVAYGFVLIGILAARD